MKPIFADCAFYPVAFLLCYTVVFNTFFAATTVIRITRVRIVNHFLEFDTILTCIVVNMWKQNANWMQQIIFIADLISCSTCFGHLYAYHQELESIIQVVAACGVWCFGFQVVGMVWSWGLCVRFAGCCLTWKPKHQTPQAAATV